MFDKLFIQNALFCNCNTVEYFLLLLRRLTTMEQRNELLQKMFRSWVRNGLHVVENKNYHGLKTTTRVLF